jgi:AcrR family transcriptional regulator
MGNSLSQSDDFVHARPARARSRDRVLFREEVVQVARRIFLERGIDQTSMALLGQKLGVSKPTLYEVFPSKKLLLEAVFKSTADDVDYGWILRAGEELPPFRVFIDQTGEGYKKLMSSPRSIEAFRLLIREGGHSTELSEAFGRNLSIPATTAARKLIAHSISIGECVSMDVEVVQKLMSAPLYHVVLDRTLFGERGMKPVLAEAYIDASMAALKSLLCTDAASAAAGARVRFREPG